MAFHYSPNVTTKGLVFYMDPINTSCYTGTGITYSSLVSLSNSTISASASYNTLTKSFDTNAVTTTYDSIVFVPSITFADASEYTLDFWIKVRNGATNFNSLCGNGGTNGWIPLFLTSTSNWYPTFRDIPTGTYNDFTTITDVDLQNWTNIVMVFKSSRNIDLYVNSIFRQSKIATNTSLIISRIASGYSSAPNYYALQGSISATKFYNIALSATEVERNFLSLKSRFVL
jgi:hypothetical protein